MYYLLGSFAILVSMQVGGAGTLPPSAPSETATWREPKNCGPNCVYGLLQLNKIKIPLRDVYEAIPVGPNGASFLDLKKGANRFGLKSKIIKSAPSQLGKIPLPAIIYLTGSREGHFVVLLEVKPESVVTVDMTTSKIEQHGLDYMKVNWSGYVLVRDDWDLISTLSTFLISSGGTILLCGLVFGFAKLNRMRLPQSA